MLTISQVHAAKLKESRKDVVVKVLKPGVEDILTVDLNFIYITARILEFLNPQLSRTSLVSTSPLNPTGALNVVFLEHELMLLQFHLN
jgi:hypothetical protein